jgi:hypothetical protein
MVKWCVAYAIAVAVAFAWRKVADWAFREWLLTEPLTAGSNPLRAYVIREVNALDVVLDKPARYVAFPCFVLWCVVGILFAAVVDLIVLRPIDALRGTDLRTPFGEWVETRILRRSVPEAMLSA